MAMEALTYDRAYAYRQEIPPKEYETWQPRKVMQLLIDIDPNADKNSSIAFGLEEEAGKPAKKMAMLGSEEVLNLATLKKHYDALGSYLHMPTLKQMFDGPSPDFAQLKERCEKIVAYLEKVLASRVFNVTLGQFATLECVRCSANIRKRVPFASELLEAKCFNCGAEYRVRNESDQQSLWEPIVEEIGCPGESCAGKIKLWRDEIKRGTWWTCNSCGKAYEICLSIAEKEATPPSE